LKLLALDSAGSASTVAVWRDGELLTRDGAAGGHHSEHLLSLLDAVLVESGLRLADLDAIAVGRGPGAFTGVRLAIGVAQGLAFAAQLPVIPVSNLEAAAERAAALQDAPARLLVCQDARMHEVYWAAYERSAAGLVPAGAEAVARPQAVTLPVDWEAFAPAWGVGTGFDAYPALLQGVRARLARCLPIESRAEDVARVAVRGGLSHGLSPELLAPLYLRDDVAALPAQPAVPDGG
jgi:tRNA threonylcarbamoyladenosine biosynthesis protein TsaB